MCAKYRTRPTHEKFQLIKQFGELITFFANSRASSLRNLLRFYRKLVTQTGCINFTIGVVFTESAIHDANLSKLSFSPETKEKIILLIYVHIMTSVFLRVILSP